MRLGAYLRRGGGGLEDVGVKEGAGRRVVQLWRHRVRLVGRGGAEVMGGRGAGVCAGRVMARVVVAWRLIRTESTGRSHGAEMRVVVERIGRQQSTAPAAAPVVQMLMFHVYTSGSGFVHGGTVSGQRAGRGSAPGALAGAGTSSDRQRRAPDAPTTAVAARLVLGLRAAEVDVRRRGLEAADQTACRLDAGDRGDPAGAGERHRVEVDTRRRRSPTGARVASQELSLTINAVQI